MQMDRTNRQFKSFRCFFALSTILLCLTAVGCESLNNDPANTRYWYPSFGSPGYLNPQHESLTGEGSDPYLDATVGPRSLQARPLGCDLQRSHTSQILNSRSSEAILTTK